MKRIFVLLIIISVTIGSIVGCGSNTSSRPEPKTVEKKAEESQKDQQSVGKKKTQAAKHDSSNDNDTKSESSKKPQTKIGTQDTDSSTSLNFESKSQEQAYKKALQYLGFTAFSHDGLVEQLEYEKFSTEDAIWAADHCGADWNEQALKKGESYLDYTSFSYNGLIEQLEYEKFTKEQATYAADILYGNSGSSSGSEQASGGSVSKENALNKAISYLDFSAFSYSGLINQLEYEGFSTEDATYAADNCGADWNEQAKKKAESYLSFSSFSRDGLIEQLVYEGFTKEQAEYGATQNGL